MRSSSKTGKRKKTTSYENILLIFSKKNLYNNRKYCIREFHHMRGIQNFQTLSCRENQQSLLQEDVLEEVLLYTMKLVVDRTSKKPNFKHDYQNSKKT